MPRKRLPENRALPLRWRRTRGAYYYQVPVGQEHLWDGKKTFRLGKTLPEAYKEWAERINIHQNTKTIGQLIDRYLAEVVIHKAPRTQADNAVEAVKLRGAFGHMSLTAIRPKHVYEYIDRREAKTRGRREIALLSHVFTKAIEWGYIDIHPFKSQVRLKGEAARTRYVEDWEILECFSLPPTGQMAMLHCYIKFKLLTGLRRGDILGLKETQIKDDGIHITTGKTGDKLIIEWSQHLRDVVEEIRALRKVDITPYLFCTTQGKSFIANGKASAFDSLWQRFMKSLLADTKITERFHEHDLRAKAGSDAESDERARKLLGHSSITTTRRFYRRKARIITPTK